MIAHGILSFYRSAISQPLYTAINVLGMALGIAVFLILMLVVRFEYSFNNWVPGVGTVYRLDQSFSFAGSAPFETAYSTFLARDLLLTDYPEIQAAARVVPRTEVVSRGAVIDDEPLSYVDPNFFDVIAAPLVAGTREHALSSAASAVITEAVARKYFQTTQVVGQALQISNAGVRRTVTVTAVLADVPANSTLPIRIMVPLTASFEGSNVSLKQWGIILGETYLRFRDQRDASVVAADLRRFIMRRAAGSGPGKAGRHPETVISLSLAPLLDLHFHDFNVAADVTGVDKRVVLSLAAVGVLAVLIASINSVNLATASAGLRAREVALRKVMGATRRMLLVQYLAESLALVGAAALLGLALAELAIPLVNASAGWSIRIRYASVAPLLALLVLIVGSAAGLYPALLLASYQPASMLAASRTQAGGKMGSRLRSMLVLAQFACATAFVICTLVIDAQADFLRDADRGFDRNGLMIVESLGAKELEPQQDTLLDAMRRVPGVVSATVSMNAPNGGSTKQVEVDRPGQPGAPPTMPLETVGRDYFQTYRVRLLSGRPFDDRYANDDIGDRPLAAHAFNAIINRAALPLLGFQSAAAALGQVLVIPDKAGKTDLTVVGVVENVRFSSPRETVSPEIYIYDSHTIPGGIGAVRVRGLPERVMMQSLQSAWHSVASGNPFVMETVDERMADFYRPDQQRARLFSAGAVLAVVIAAFGLYGLASFNTARRVREIGIRKVLGASMRDVLVLLLGQFIRPVLLANLIAWPIAWVLMRGWLGGFDQRIALSPGYFIAATIGALVISVLTVLGQAWAVARAEPADALRYE